MSYTYTIISLNHRNANQKLENIPEHTTELLLSSLHLGGRLTEEQLTQFFEKLSEFGKFRLSEPKQQSPRSNFKP